ncbi:ATP-dependent helicase [Desulfomonile tiedjei]|uniref:DNA 3'-5' helicase n=1 Tax=Desulfomonile tiedjei (strain ATCC 49306 / DSM 6799 / DCB-1) TaxID=706587 RepID=I4C6V6_DESTA|nr:ATP-dependent helicase [Desulfomonile tiedjei]AFM25297.1 DNA/RNA helicase, superfamily I [Desulfomonile tiedjei DSM 6799]
MKKTGYSNIAYEQDLNSAQLEAVTAPEGPLLIIAGAGSGKTRTIVYRVAWLVEQGIEPESILLLTFTRKAAEEMLSRASQLLGLRLTAIAGGTFHSTGNMLLRRYAALLGFDSSFSIMDQGDSVEAIDHVKKNLVPPLTDPKGFPKTRTIAEIISRAVGCACSVNEAIEKRCPHFGEFAPEIDIIKVKYEEHKKNNNLMDYDDLLVNTIKLLEEHPRIRTEISEKWRYVLVDEYQDTNRLQARIVQLLAFTHDNVMVVGDDSQSIYSFRGADFTNIVEFPNLFPGTRIIRLEENYRSTAPILSVTNSIIQRAAAGYSKRLFTQKTGGPLPISARSSTERQQSKFVVQCVRELNEHGVELNEIAVLFRAGFHSFDLESELTRNNIAFVKYGGFKFLESQHIKDVLAHLKVIHNPADRLSWIRILKLLPGVGDKTALQLAGTICQDGIPRSTAQIVSKPPKYGKDLDRLLELVFQLKNETNPISQKVELINAYYFPVLKEKYDNYPKRMRDLEYLADLTSSYKSLNRFLNDMALEPPDEERSSERERQDSLVLSTIHSAKGLEWHTVILIWAAEGRIPSPMALVSPDDLEEERRLMYVATTRAKHNLVIVAPHTALDRTRGQVPVKLSRFVEEIPQDYFRTYSV